MPFEEKIEEALAQATSYYWKAWNKKPSVEEVIARFNSIAYPDSPSVYDENCYEGMKILLSLCGDKFSGKHICKLLPTFYNLVDTTANLSQQQISDMLHNIYQSYLDWNEKTTVYFPVECIKVIGDNAVAFGNILFWDFNTLLKNKHGEFLDIWLKERSKIDVPETVASFSIVADLQKTRDVGRQAINDVLNVIQFVNPLSIVHDQAPHFLLSEIYQRRHAATFRIINDCLDIDSMYRTDSAQMLYLPLNGNPKRVWNESFGDAAVAIMQSKCKNITDILRQAIYWHATGERETSRERALIFYTMALEAVLTQMGGGVSTQATIADSLALLLGKNLDQRLEIKGKAKELYHLRSQLSHGSKSAVSKYDLEIQRYFSYSAIKFVFSNRDNFKNRADIIKYFENLKFTLPDDGSVGETVEVCDANA